MIYNPLIYQEALVIFIKSVFVFQFNEYFFKSPLDYGQTSNKHRILRCGAYYRKLFITRKNLTVLSTGLSSCISLLRTSNAASG